MVAPPRPSVPKRAFYGFFRKEGGCLSHPKPIWHRTLQSASIFSENISRHSLIWGPTANAGHPIGNFLTPLPSVPFTGGGLGITACWEQDWVPAARETFPSAIQGKKGRARNPNLNAKCLT